MSSITDMLSQSAQTPIAGTTGGFVLGRVANNFSGDFPGQVQVNFTGWKDGKNLSEWMPVLSPYAGKEHGHYWIPEIDDIVLVGFFGPMLEKPFVMGSFYPVGASIPKDKSVTDNPNRFVKTKGGVTFAVIDEDEKQSVDIQTPKGLRLWVEDENETITITDKDGQNVLKLDCKGGEISVTAAKKLTLTAGKCSIEMDGNAGGLSIKCDQLKVEAGQTAEIKSNNMLTLKGSMAKMEGQQLTLSGSAMCEIKGGMVKIN